jgi:hypothetical protein
MFSFEMTFDNIILSLIILVVICTLLFLCIEYRDKYPTKLLSSVILCLFTNNLFSKYNFDHEYTFIQSIIFAFAILHSINIIMFEHEGININHLLFPMNTLTYFLMIFVFAAVGIYFNSTLLCEISIVFFIMLFADLCGYLCGYITMDTNFNKYTHKSIITIVYFVEIIPSITISSTFVACIGKIIENSTNILSPDLLWILKLFVPNMINISVLMFYIASIILLVCIYKKSVLYVKEFIVLYLVEWFWLLILTKITSILGTFLCMLMFMLYFSCLHSKIASFTIRYFEISSNQQKEILKILLFSFSNIFLLLNIYVLNEYLIKKYCLQYYFHLIPTI